MHKQYYWKQHIYSIEFKRAIILNWVSTGNTPYILYLTYYVPKGITLQM